MQVERDSGECKTRTFVRVSNVSPSIDIAPFNHNIDTLERAVKERVFFVKENGQFVPPPRPQEGYFQSCLDETTALLEPLLPSTAPWTHQEFLDSYRDGRKKKVYKQALDRYETESINIKDESRVSVFVKREKTDRTTKLDPVPRVISPRSPIFNVEIGVYLKKLEHMMFKSINQLFGHDTVFKGYTYERQAELLREKWDSFHCPVAVGLDASRFDQHVSKEALKWEHAQYLKCFHGSDQRKLSNLLKLQLNNYCSGNAPDGKLKYTVEGTRMSGDMNTSLGNCLIMCCMIHQYSLDRGVKISLANNGDDCVVFMEKRDLLAFSTGLDAWFRKMGFNMTVEKPVYTFEHIEFCQTKPIFDGNMWTMCRNPWTALSKDSVMLDHRKGFFKLWLNAVGTGGLSLAGGLPIFDSFYRMLQRSGSSSYKSNTREWNIEDLSGMTSWSFRHGGSGRSSCQVTDDARISFWDAFGVLPDDQVELELYYDSMNITSDMGDLYQGRPIYQHVE